MEFAVQCEKVQFIFGRRNDFCRICNFAEKNNGAAIFGFEPGGLSERNCRLLLDYRILTLEMRYHSLRLQGEKDQPPCRKLQTQEDRTV